MKNPMPDIIAREKRIKAAVAAGVGEVGIFVFTSTTEIQGDSLPYTEGFDKGEFVKGASSHYFFWRNFKKNFEAYLPNIKDMEYNKLPRGRVVYSKKDETFLVYGPIEIISNQSMCLMIKKDFSLAGTKVKYIRDSHYEMDRPVSLMSEEFDRWAGDHMDRRNIPCSNSSSASSASTPPKLLSQFRVKSYPAMPVPLNEGEAPAAEYDILKIKAVGVGPLGSQMVQLLARNVAGINCHEIFLDVEQESTGDIAALLSSVWSSDLLFIVTGFDDEYCGGIVQEVGRSACGAGVLTLCITSGISMVQKPPQCDGHHEKWFDTVFSVSDESLPSHEGIVLIQPEALIGYSMRNLVATITSLVTHRTGICIDFADIIGIMHQGGLGMMGVGVASGSTRGTTAAQRAIERLAAQGVDISSAVGILASVHGSGDISIDDLDAASKVIHKQISPEANVIIGVISDENLGGFVKVTVLAVHWLQRRAG